MSTSTQAHRALVAAGLPFTLEDLGGGISGAVLALPSGGSVVVTPDELGAGADWILGVYAPETSEPEAEHVLGTLAEAVSIARGLVQ